MNNKIPVGISNRHIHLSSAHLASLFGEGYELQELKPLSQPGQYAAQETVTIVGAKGEIGNVRILGPIRPKTQIEISKTDSFKLGVAPPVRDSGDTAGSPGLKVVGPKGEVELEEGVIIAARHIHFHPSDAKSFGVADGDKVSIRTQGERSVVFENVLCRVHEQYALDCHLDTDEGNAAGLKTGEFIELIK
ncbi:phosphate propanoyltransferase [Bacillus horti]|uniref:Phosphate propanoyltransferase n=1 Tax=Caldalkalibacillus horti TaxID=77523 RepID=A0ABT9W4G0_9BACI|nr:phosphate propanoyltransferase [Bacillus horti]MDQ0168121.1 putative phosphotransacetylase [Bacillus horti]